jgi:Putative esterase
MGHTETYRVYTPACYRQQTNRRYPVIYLLHGGEHNEEHWDNVGVDEAADTLIAGGTIPPLLIVLPDGGQDFGTLKGNPRHSRATCTASSSHRSTRPTALWPIAITGRWAVSRTGPHGRCCWPHATPTPSARLARIALRLAHSTASILT